MQSDTTSTSKAAVPIPVYRELAAELQAAQAKIIQLQNQNDRLVKENKILAEELENLFNAYNQSQETIKEAHEQSQSIINTSQERLRTLFQPPKTKEQQEIVVDESQITRPTIESAAVPPEMTETAPLNRSWMTLLICMIVLISFSAGYFLIKASQKR
jgi:predicted nuclease with TOPRIM domain